MFTKTIGIGLGILIIMLAFITTACTGGAEPKSAAAKANSTDNAAVEIQPREGEYVLWEGKVELGHIINFMRDISMYDTPANAAVLFTDFKSWPSYDYLEMTYTGQTDHSFFLANQLWMSLSSWLTPVSSNGDTYRYSIAKMAEDLAKDGKSFFGENYDDVNGVKMMFRVGPAITVTKVALIKE
jgi:hypothetical protein